MSTKTQFSEEWLKKVVSYFNDLDFWDRRDASDDPFNLVAACASNFWLFPAGLLDQTKLIDGRLPEQQLLRLPFVVNNRVWCQDAEADFKKGDYWYIRTLLEWSRISRGCFQPQYISEIWLPLRTTDQEYPDSPDEPIEISYELGGKEWKFELLECGGWVDSSLIRKVNETISGTGYQFAIVEPASGNGDQCLYICCFTMAEVLKLKSERGWKFYEDDFCIT